jgi:DNA-binding NarL/FixJ family response regulator
MTAPTYSDREIVEALDLAIAGRDSLFIAEETGLSPHEVAVLVRTYTTGLLRAREARKPHRATGEKPGRPSCLSDEQRARVLQLRSEGLTYPEVAAAVGCTERNARYIAEVGR